MNMKNTVIILLFLLCILGLIIGVYYTEAGEASKEVSKYEKGMHEEDGVTTVSLEEIEKEEKGLNKFFT